jgi:hypothetical protein
MEGQRPPEGFPPEQPPPAQQPPPPPPPAPPGGDGEDRRRPPAWIFIGLAALLAAGVAIAIVLASGGGTEKASAQVVRFQRPTDPGPKPFTKPSDVIGKHAVAVASGPFGGTGSNLVCNRELLIRFLHDNPDRLAAWAIVEGITPNYRAVARYIRSLKPVTLTRDTQVTNHSFEGGHSTEFQSILQAGTAVLVDPHTGKYVARCRCGNPLLPPVYTPSAVCYGCPPNYTPPPPCSTCFRSYPNPPPVIVINNTNTNTNTNNNGNDANPPPDTSNRGTPSGGGLQCNPPRSQLESEQCAAQGGGGGQSQPQRNPSASISPSSGTVSDSYSISVSGFRPNATLNMLLQRPDGGQENYTIQTDSSGSGGFAFPHVNSPQPGPYHAHVTDPQTGDTADTATVVNAG